MAINLGDPFTVAKPGKHEPKAIYQRLIKSESLFEDQMTFEPQVGFLMRNFDLVEAGRLVLGSVHMPMVQGKLKTVFDWMIRRLFGDLPDFIMILDADYWEASDELQREILVYHETCHMQLKRNNDGDIVMNELTGRPKWKLVGHDVEEFTAVVAKYGAHDVALRAFVDAANSVQNGGL